MKFANFEAIGRVKGVDFFSKNIVTLILSILIVLFAVLSVSGMTLHKNAESSSFSFILAIDSSRSMEARDFTPNRLEAAKSTAINFVKNAPPGTRVGVISFSGNTYMEEEITNKMNNVKNAISNIGIGSIEGTDIYEAVITSTNLLKGEDAKAAILLSDGQVTVGDADMAVQYANKNNVMIHTIAIGTVEGGETSYGISRLDKEALESIAYHTGGKFFNPENNEEFSSSFEEAFEYTERKVSVELSGYFLVALIIVFILKYFLINTRYRIFP
jgi:Ca-activated chloride channel family protein